MKGQAKKKQLRHAAQVMADLAWEHIKDLPEKEMERRIEKFQACVKGLVFAVICKTGRVPK